MRVIGTAGHVDHGKSTLIAALTGTHPDRLKEEQAREMTIELGFGWMTLPNGEEVGIVDVPGHRDFIENMLSGIGGIDAALLVIAADEGVMPQTREHLAILDLLQIPAGIIVLTKTDLVSDPDWLDLVETDIRAVVAATVLNGAPIVRVSAKEKTGLASFISSLERILQQKPARPDLSRPRLPIDRVFSMSGFGTVVTGTLLDGHLAVGDEVEILPSGVRGRVRGLQTHRKKEDRAISGSRTAANISGVETENIRRGEVVTRPGQYRATRRIDASFHLLRDASSSLQHAQEVKFFVGASETIASLRLLGKDELIPGADGWIQLELRDPVVAVRGDRYILRRPSPPETLGGGVIVDHNPKGRHKRFDEGIQRSLEALAKGSPSDILFEAALASNAASIKEVVSQSRLDPETADRALKELVETGQLIPLEEGSLNTISDALVIALPHWKTLRDKTLQIVESYHRNLPLRRGIPREELKSRLKVTPRLLNAVIRKLERENLLTAAGGTVWIAGHEIRFDNGQQAKIQVLMRKFEQNPYSPPTIKECYSETDKDTVNALIELGELTPVSEDIIFRKQDYDLMVTKIRETIKQNGKITLAEVRDIFKTSRKYAQALLEHLDAIGVTVRDGDHRILSKK
ncbi:MAG TPA: selenocysteine-specific translation elongation factor [Anaerolineales bacterium]|nr:selenocysteine-specific translation elongation factor [Anaerolineales bacterium]